jgi:uncharacterized protein YjbI with pentapeptide repeats
VPSALSRSPGDRGQALLIGVWRDFRVRRGQIAVFCLLARIIMALSMCARQQSPRETPAKLLNFVGLRTYADLREVNVAERPDGWDGKDWGEIKQVDLRGRNLAFVDATSAFLANADLRGANVNDAGLGFAQLQGANLSEAQLQGADLQGADLNNADLQ